MKKFALFTMLLCSGLMYGCQPSTEPTGDDKDKTTETEGETGEGTGTTTETPAE